MRLWTIEAELGCSGRAIARRLAAEAGVPLVDCWASVASRLGYGTTSREARDLEEIACSRVIRWGLVMGLTARASPELVHELSLPERCRHEFEQVVQEAARDRCVIIGHRASVILADHPGALHARIHAPREWRVHRLAVQHLLPLSRAASDIRRADRRQRRAARWIFDREKTASHFFHFECDASRLSQEGIVDVLLGVRPVSPLGVSGTELACVEHGSRASSI
jgi:cytidylate kinase